MREVICIGQEEPTTLSLVDFEQGTFFIKMYSNKSQADDIFRENLLASLALLLDSWILF